MHEFFVNCLILNIILYFYLCTFQGLDFDLEEKALFVLYERTKLEVEHILQFISHNEFYDFTVIIYKL